MNPPINLNRARKDRARAEARRIANENARKFGRTNVQRVTEMLQADAARVTLEAHKIDK